MIEQIAIYTRLSKEDAIIAEESNSITNQKAFIRHYIQADKDLKKMQILEFSDDGYTGKNMERPDMHRMLELIKAKKISCIIVKDFSRFSRDHIEQGKYIQQVFPFMNVRFISINDGYDSKNYMGRVAEIDIAFKQLLYDFYSEDLSAKVKTSLKTLRESGKYISSSPNYGYAKSKTKKYKLEVDEMAAEIVRRIYKEYLEGKSMYRIVKQLNDDEIEAPGIYIAKRNQNVNLLERYKEKSCIWTVTAVSRILENKNYIGSIIYNRFESTSVGSKRSKQLPKDKWKCIEQCHQPIVSKKDFERVQAIKKEKSNTRTQGNNKERNCLSGKVICGECGHALAHTYAGRPKYYCQTRYRKADSEKCSTSILDEELEKLVLEELCKHMDIDADMKAIVVRKKAEEEEKIMQVQNHLKEMEKSLELIQEDLRGSYEAYRMEMTNKETYLEQKQMYEQMIEELEENVAKQRAVRAKLVSGCEVIGGNREAGKGEQDVEVLTRELVERYVEKVVVRGEVVKIELK